MLVTIITVCYNAADCIEKTITSVLCQTYGNIEYIIKDGGSTDGTNDIIQDYRAKFEQKGIRFMHMVRKDCGIYDAMNQATEVATGEYINYMNADDIFWNATVVEDVFGDRKYTEDVLYGDAICEYEFIKGKKEYTLWRGQHQHFELMPFSHQACFIRAATIKKYYYDTKYRNASDFKLMLRLFKEGLAFKNVGRIICICTMDGVSNTNIMTSYSEAVQAKRELAMEPQLAGDTRFSMWLMGVKQWVLETLPYWFVGRLLRFQVWRKGNRIYRSIGEITGERREDVQYG